MTHRTAESTQGVVALLGITLGAIPLVKVVLGGDVGFWLGWLPGTGNPPGAWLIPLVVVVVAVLALVVLDRLDDGT